jgi:hypothetical protein
MVGWARTVCRFARDAHDHQQEGVGELAELLRDDDLDWVLVTLEEWESGLG